MFPFHLLLSPAEEPLQAAPEILVCGAHRASGATTLSTLLAPAHDLGRSHEALTRIGTRPRRPLVLTCRSSAWAAPCAVTAAETLAGSGTAPDILVIVRDGWPLTVEAAARFREASQIVGTVIPFPYIRRPQAMRPARSVRQALADIRAFASVRSGDTTPGGGSHALASS